MTTIAHSIPLQRKVANLVDELTDRYDNEPDNADYLLDRLLDRLTELTQPSTIDTGKDTR